MRKFMSLCMALLVGFLMPQIVQAAEVLPEAVDGKITLTEDVTLTSAFVVESGKNITLDLAGFTLKNDTSLKADTIYVKKGATLKLTGNGTVINTTKGYAALYNNGTTVIDGATLKRDTTGDNNYYVILNHGNMTIEDANVSVNGTGSSLVENGYYDFTSTDERKGYVEGVNEKNPKLVVNGGMFDGGMNTIKNDDNAVLEINDGTFKNSYQVSLMNWNIATINGGTFETPAGNDKTNIFVASYGADSVDKGVLVINGGTFNAEHLLEGYKGLTTPVEINGGEFNNTDTFFNEDPTKTPSATVANGAEIKGEVEAPVSALKYAKEGATVTLNSELNLDDVIEVPQGVTVLLPDDEIGEKVFVDNGDGTFTIAESADITKLLEVLEKVLELNEDDYTEKSLKEFEDLLTSLEDEIGELNFTKDEQDKVDAITKKIENGMAKLVKKNSNPETGDNILLYVSLGIVSLLGCGFVVKSKKFN